MQPIQDHKAEIPDCSKRPDYVNNQKFPSDAAYNVSTKINIYPNPANERIKWRSTRPVSRSWNGANVTMNSARRLLVRGLTICMVCVILAGGLETASAQNHPNILFILTDDVGWGDIKAYNPNSQVSLPSIETLAAEGMRFTDAHTSAAKCAPSRYSIVSGNYQWRGKISYGQWNYKGGSQILPGQLTLGHILQQAGYSTAFIGKHHLGAQFYLKNSDNFASGSAPESDVDFSRQFRDGPLETGFDYSFVAMRGIQDSPYAFFENDLLFGNADDLIHWFSGNYGDTEIRREGGGIGLPDWNTREVGPTLLEKAVEFIDTHHRSNVALGTSQPFFLYYNSQAVHDPHRPPFTLRGTPILGTSGISVRADLLREIDEALKVIQAELASRGLLENTLIIFTSDNGANRLIQEANLGHDALGGLRGSKGNIFEGGHRVPLIVKWGDGTEGGSMIQPGVVSNVLIGMQDMYATIANLVGIGVMEDQGRDSFNVLPVLLGQSDNSIRDHMILEARRDENGDEVPRHFAFREGNWKLILNDNDKPRELYNLANDLQETTNLINRSSEATRIDQMLSRFTMLRSADRSAPSNKAPTASPLPNGSATEGQFFNQDLSSGFVDPDGDPLTFTATGLPAGLSINADTGVVSGTPTSADVSNTPYIATISATDPSNATAQAEYSIVVMAAPMPPIQPSGGGGGSSFSLLIILGLYSSIKRATRPKRQLIINPGPA